MGPEAPLRTLQRALVGVGPFILFFFKFPLARSGLEGVNFWKISRSICTSVTLVGFGSFVCIFGRHLTPWNGIYSFITREHLDIRRAFCLEMFRSVSN